MNFHRLIGFDCLVLWSCLVIILPYRINKRFILQPAIYDKYKSQKKVHKSPKNIAMMQYSYTLQYQIDLKPEAQ